MAAVPVTFQGILFFSDAGVGGGPMPGGPSVSHPIAPGGQPPGIWGGGNMPYPDQGLPGNQPYPGQGLPGNQPYPGQGLPGQQPGVSHPIAPGGGGGGQPPYPSTGPGFPTAPIFIPPDNWPDKPPGPNEMVIVVWVPGSGYTAMVVPKPPGMNIKPPEGGSGSGSGRPDQSLPGSQPKPDQSLPGSQPKPDQGLPTPPPSSGSQPPTAGQPLPPTAQPKK